MLTLLHRLKSPSAVCSECSHMFSSGRCCSSTWTDDFRSLLMFTQLRRVWSLWVAEGTSFHCFRATVQTTHICQLNKHMYSSWELREKPAKITDPNIPITIGKWKKSSHALRIEQQSLLWTRKYYNFRCKLSSQYAHINQEIFLKTNETHVEF